MEECVEEHCSVVIVFFLVELVLIWFFPVFFPTGFFFYLVFSMGDVEQHLPKYTYVVVYAPSSCCILKVCV